MPLELFDTHCHVHFRAYDADRDAVLRRAREAGVQMITIGTNEKTSRSAIQLAEQEPHVWAAIGLHPTHLAPAPPDLDEEESHGIEIFDPALYRNLAQSKKVVAIGESGLDFYRSADWVNAEEEKEKQIANFRAHLDLAHELKLPIVIHCRDAHEMARSILAEYIEAGKLFRRGVIHCFTGTRAEAEAYLPLGFYISFAGIVTFPPRKGQTETLAQIAAALPLDQILIETDAPYLSPVPFRGKRNEPAYVVHIAETIAAARGLTFAEVAEATTQNAKQIFAL